MLKVCVCICLKIRLLNQGVLIAKNVFTNEHLHVGQRKAIECFQQSGTWNVQGSPAASAERCNHFMPDKTCFQHILQWSSFTLDVSSMLPPCLASTEGSKLLYLSIICSDLSCWWKFSPILPPQPLTLDTMLSLPTLSGDQNSLFSGNFVTFMSFCA